MMCAKGIYAISCIVVLRGYVYGVWDMQIADKWCVVPISVGMWCMVCVHRNMESGVLR